MVHCHHLDHDQGVDRQGLPGLSPRGPPGGPGPEGPASGGPGFGGPLPAEEPAGAGPEVVGVACWLVMDGSCSVPAQREVSVVRWV